MGVSSGWSRLWVWLRMRALRNIDHKWAWFHLSSALANSIDIAACSTGLSLFLPVYHWSKCGLEGKKVGRPWPLRFLRYCNYTYVSSWKWGPLLTMFVACSGGLRLAIGTTPTFSNAKIIIVEMSKENTVNNNFKWNLCPSMPHLLRSSWTQPSWNHSLQMLQ
jgi:hypothetical protein